MSRTVKTSVEVDATALEKCMEILGPGTTQRAAINAALRSFIRPRVNEEFDAYLATRQPTELDKLQDEAWHR
ncbi:MAG: type II toxin-antitoxin system VapB family antitoxin [Candidatus Nanopelagicales bacterium]|nr:type II toxin-antitoxin system VapB family antitoxin [Candidatus Nanopelagicales bacterium]